MLINKHMFFLIWVNCDVMYWKNIEDKIPDIVNLAINTTINTK